MLKRFKEIHQEHEKEFSRLNVCSISSNIFQSSIELNKKKLELFNETLRLGELNVKEPKINKVAVMSTQNRDLERNVSMAQSILR